MIPKQEVHYPAEESSTYATPMSLWEGSIAEQSSRALMFGGHEREADKLAPLCITSSPTRMPEGVSQGESEGERVDEGDGEGDDVSLLARIK